MMRAPVVIVPCSSKAAYLERYAEPDKGWTDRDEARWPMPFWHMDTAMASLLILQTAVDEGLGACFFGIPPERDAAVRAEFGIPDDFDPVGVITIGHPATRRPAPRPARRPGGARKPLDEVVHRGRWGHPRQSIGVAAAGSTTARPRVGLASETRRVVTAHARPPTGSRTDARSVPPSDADAGPQRAVAKLQALVRIPTVSHRDPALVDIAAFDAFLAELERQFPLLHERLELTRIDTHGLLVPLARPQRRAPGRADGAPRRRPGRRGRALAAPAVRRRRSSTARSGAAAPSTTRARWSRSARPSRPCSRPGTRRRRTSGSPSAATRRSPAAPRRSAVEELVRRGVRPWFVLDEGGAIAHEAFPGVAAPIGVIGVTEKGATSLRAARRGPRRARLDPGPERPDRPAGPGRSLRLERAPMPASLPEPTLELLRRMAPHAPPALRPLLANAARLRPVAHPRAGRRRARDRRR